MSTTRTDPIFRVFPDESFDFVYSYAVFQHIPSREVVFGYLPEARRVLKPGGILRCQFNGLPEHPRAIPPGTACASPPRMSPISRCRHDFQLLALEGVATQYMWTTWREAPPGWRVALRPAAPLRYPHPHISNAPDGRPAGARFRSARLCRSGLENLPDDCRPDRSGSPDRWPARGALSYLGPPEWDGVVQFNVAAACRHPHRPGAGEVFWLGRPLTARA